MTGLPQYYFRSRDNGAQVFRLDSDPRNQRLDMEPIATLNLRSGEIRAQGPRSLTEADMAAIRAWIEERQDLLARRETDDILRTVDQLNQTAHWAQGRASDDQIAAVAGALMLAMHDLRAVLVRRQADRLSPSGKARAQAPE